MQIKKGLGFPNKYFATQNKQMYIRLHCLRMLWNLSTCIPKFKNHFAIRTVRFQVQLEADGYFLQEKFFAFATATSRASWYQLAIFWICFLQIRLQKHLLGFAQTQYSAQNCAGYASSLTLNKQIFLEKKLFQKNRHWFIQYCIKPKLLLPVLKVKSGSIPSGFSLGFS